MKNILSLLIIVVCWAFTANITHALVLQNVGDPQQFVFYGKGPLPESFNSWQPYEGIAPQEGDTFVFRQAIQVSYEEGEVVDNPLAFAIAVSGVYSFYWDDELLGSNRRGGSDASLYSRVSVPISKLTEGEHVITLYINAIGVKPGEAIYLHIEPASVTSDNFGVHPTVVSTFFVATAAFFVACYLMLLLFTAGNRPGLMPAILLSLSIFALILLTQGQYLFNYSYLYQPMLNQLNMPLSLAIFVLLLWFTLTRLNYKNREPLMLIIPAMLALASIDVGPFEYHFKAVFILTTILIGLSIYAKHKGEATALIFLISFGIAYASLWIDPHTLHLFLITMTLLLAIDLGLDIKRQAQTAAHHALISERLRADLLKRNIQPHFLMNSLSALMEWTEVAPEMAVTFIDGLASEFRILSDFSERTSVTVGEELALCNIHLKLMSMRYGATFKIKSDSLDKEARIPPAIFHTLIENAFSHNNYARKDITFDIAYERRDDRDYYAFKTPINEAAENRLGTGSGTRYILARLEEFCDKAYSFKSQLHDLMWVTAIEIGTKGR